ncbi:ribosome-recycling factor, mitochondrial [Adelges cooleyi]|uniref:ribosome-recycling factor, mitochondrial n=1 Tax=Adelges cooleyi TaxID=133065 RepID=UPI00217F43E9|nr:ribosome-recycling factor, mitochondrial [Adelges cooleyi]XP_050421804.1 ribosome-recycling factor, mitochondrial [Adelges cooleyi]
MYKITSALGRNLNCALPPCRRYTYCAVRQYNNLNGRRLCPSPSLLSAKFVSHNCCALGSVRNYAKGKDKKKDKGQKKVSIDENLLSQYLKFNNMKSEMEKAVVNLKNNYIKNLSLRSSTGALESLPVIFEGDEYVVQDLAQIVRKNPKTIILNMSSFPLAIPAVLESLKNSGMNLNPQQEKTSIFIPIPKVTKEHRENLSKGAKALFVKCKDSIKEIQNKNIKLLKDNDSLSEDLVHNLKDQITMLADMYVIESQRIMEEKQNELKGD